MELAWLLDPRAYGDGPTVSVVETRHRAYTIRAYIKFNLIYNDRQEIVMDDKRSKPMDVIFQYSFHKFAITIYKYKLRQTTTGAINHVNLRRNLLKHIERFRPTTKTVVERDMGIAARELPICKSFSWTGPDFTIEPRENGDMSMTGIFDLFSQTTTLQMKIDPQLFSLNKDPIDADVKFILGARMKKAEIEKDEELCLHEADLEFKESDMDSTMLALQEIRQSRPKVRLILPINPEPNQPEPDQPEEEPLEDGEIPATPTTGQKHGLTRSPT